MNETYSVIQQQYGLSVEKVPPKLNHIDIGIILSQYPYEIKALVFRDIGFGDKLVTEKIAKEMSKGLEALSRRLSEEFKLRLKY